jgi:hypothetical protein
MAHGKGSAIQAWCGINGRFWGLKRRWCGFLVHLDVSKPLASGSTILSRSNGKDIVHLPTENKPFIAFILP